MIKTTHCKSINQNTSFQIMQNNEDHADVEEFGKYVKLNGTTYIYCKIETNCEYPYECVKNELVLVNGHNYVKCYDTEGHIIVFPYSINDVFIGETIKHRAMNLRAGDELFVKQKFCPVIGCRNRKTHVANEQCVVVKLPRVKQTLCVEVVTTENEQQLPKPHSVENTWSRSIYNTTTSPTHVGDFAFSPNNEFVNSPQNELYRKYQPKRRYVHAKRRIYGYQGNPQNNFF